MREPTTGCVNAVAGSRELAIRYQLDSDPAQVSHAREQTRKALPQWGLGEHTDVAELIVSELVANAVVHGAGQMRL